MSRELLFSPGVAPDVAIRDDRVHLVFGHGPWTWLELAFDGELVSRRELPRGYYPKTNGEVSLAHDGERFIRWTRSGVLSEPAGDPRGGMHCTGISPSGLEFFWRAADEAYPAKGAYCGDALLPNPYASYGIWESRDDGTCRTWDECFYTSKPGGAGQTHHSQDGRIWVRECATGGIEGAVDGTPFVLWPGQNTMWPRCAHDGTHAAIVTWRGGPQVRVWIGTLAELAALGVPEAPAVPQDIAPFAAHFWAWAYNNLCVAPENVMTLSTGKMVVPDRAVGWNLAIEDPAAMSRVALACKADTDVPVYAYMGGHVPETLVDGVDYPLIQAYRLPGCETAAAILAQLRSDVARCAYPRVGLAVDLTARTLADGVPWSEADRIAFLLGLADLCREIRPAAVFAWCWDRKPPQAGISSSPVIAEQWRRFVAAIPPAPIVAPPEPPQPPEVPPMQPYPDEPTIITPALDAVAATFAEAGHAFNPGMGVHVVRMQRDYDEGMSWLGAQAKHLRLLRAQLGLESAPAPSTPPADTWPRLGLSYYTSLTDPRLDLAGFAARLRDAGADYTRVWLLDAWAVSANGGPGCYDGYLPWVRRDGRFDLDQVDPWYLERLRAYVEAMNAVGVLPQLSGLELYSWSSRKAGMLWVPDANRGPFRLNHQGVRYAEDDALERIGQPSGADAFLGHCYQRVVETLAGTTYTVELANEMPEKPLHERLAVLWRTAGYLGSISVNRQDDTPGQFANMRIGRPGGYDRIAFHGKRDLSYLDEDFPREPEHRTFRQFYLSRPDPTRIILSSDGCRKSTSVDDAYDYDALGAVFRDSRTRGFSVEHQSCLKLRGFTEGRIDPNDLEVDWMRSLTA